MPKSTEVFLWPSKPQEPDNRLDGELNPDGTLHIYLPIEGTYNGGRLSIYPAAESRPEFHGDSPETVRSAKSKRVKIDRIFVREA